MWSFVTDAPSAVQMFMLISCVLMGVSHIVQPTMWVDFFGRLVERGSFGLVINQFINSGIGALIVTLHQVWSGPAIVLTLYGWALTVKAVIGLWAPQLGMRSMKLSRHGDNAFRVAGAGMLVVGLCCAAALAGFGMPVAA